jgi:dolichol-phosphate mannosyltransferase
MNPMTPADAVRYWKLLNEGWDCVFGSRFIKGGGVIDYPPLKLFVNRLANYVHPRHFPDSAERYNQCLQGLSAHGHCRLRAADRARILISRWNCHSRPSCAVIRGRSFRSPGATGGSARPKLKIKEMGSRYFFICAYIWLEKYFSRGDYRRSIDNHP